MDAATEEMNRLGGWEFREQAEEMLKRVGLPNSGQLVGSLSGGQKRRVALAAALLANPDLIVADEPTNHMDHQVGHHMWCCLQTWHLPYKLSSIPI